MVDLLPRALAGIDGVAMAAAITALLVVWLAGRLVTGPAAPALVSVGAGWGIAVLLMTLVGATLKGPLWPVVAVLFGLAGVALARDLRARAAPAEFLGCLGLVLPAMLLVSGRMASEWDEFSHWLHAFRFLIEADALPGTGRGDIHSCCAAYPYGWPLLGLVGGRLFGFSEGMPGLINLGLLALAGGLLGRVMEGTGVPVWPARAAGVLLATALGPTFVPKLVFTAYADVPTAVMALAMAWLGIGLSNRGGARTYAALGLAAAALVAQKPSNLVVAVMILGVAALMAARERGRTLGRADLAGLVLAVAPMLLVWLLWRRHVGEALAGQEMRLLGFDEWAIARVGAIVARMASVAANKGGYFGIMLAALVPGAAFLLRPTSGNRVFFMAGAAFAGYNLFLLFAYVAIFGEGEGTRAASYWRYNTHLGLLSSMVVAAALGWLVGRRTRGPAIWRTVTGGALALLLVGPLAGVRYLRFDIEEGKTFLRAVMADVDRATAGSVFIVDPEGSGVSFVMATYAWDGTPRMAGFVTAFSPGDAAAMAQRSAKADHALVVSWNATVETAFPGLVRRSAVVLIDSRTGAVRAEWPYPGGREPRNYP